MALPSTNKAIRSGNPVLVAAFILYGTLILLWVTIPGSVVSWIKGFEDGTMQQVALRMAEGVQAVSGQLGLNGPYLFARRLYLQRVRGE